MSHEIKTSVIDNNLNPVWKDVLQCNIDSKDIDNLAKHAHLTFALWDEDKSNEDDVIGAVVISFKEIFDEIAKTEKATNGVGYYDFEKVVLDGAVYRGKLKGRIAFGTTIADIRSGSSVPAAAAATSAATSGGGGGAVPSNKV